MNYSTKFDKITSLLMSLLAFFATSFSSSVGAGQSKLTLSKQDCQRLIRHQAHSDVEFRPGVDVRGKNVKSADLYGDSPLTLPYEFSFKLNIDIAKKYGLDKKGISADMPVGIVKVRGRNVYFNDQLLSSGDWHAIAAGCQKTIKGR